MQDHLLILNCRRKILIHVVQRPDLISQTQLQFWNFVVVEHILAVQLPFQTIDFLIHGPNGRVHFFLLDSLVLESHIRVMELGVLDRQFLL